MQGRASIAKRHISHSQQRGVLVGQLLEHHHHVMHIKARRRCKDVVVRNVEMARNPSA